ncbi:MAG: hypothetical protein IPQ07_26460 [Myxococcales bacterium]|nr:hypothetical protein [Myxococcales bacterium]
MRSWTLYVTLLVAACAPAPPVPARHATPSSVAPGKPSSRPPFEDTLRLLKTMEYPDAELRAKAVRARFAAEIGVCRWRGTEAMSDEAFQAVASMVPAELFRALKVARDRRSTCSSAEATEALQSIDRLVATFASELAWRAPTFDPSAPILLSQGPCQCELDHFDHAATAFYPYWLRGKVPATPLGALGTIAYVGMTFDDDGNVRHVESPGRAGEPAGEPFDLAHAELVRTAHAAGVGVDWVIQQPDWARWSARTAAERRRVFDALATSLARISSTDRRDGVTLWFTGYPADAGAERMFDDLISAIVTKQKAGGMPGRISVLVPQDAVGAGLYDYRHLVNLVGQMRPDAERSQGGAVFVLLEEPTTESKKRLRMGIEEAPLQGPDRRRLLRAIVPVITFDGRSWQQLSDDEIYAAYNYAGLGFWLSSTELKPSRASR